MEVVNQPSLRELTTLRMGGRAECGVRIQKPTDWEDLSDFLQKRGLDPLFAGRGSNLLVREGDLPLVLVLQTSLGEIRTWALDSGRVRVQADAGTGLGRLLSRLGSMGLSGLEGLTGIPASLGGAVAMNAGSWGQSMGEVLARVQIWTPGQGLEWVERERLGLGYRVFHPGQEGMWCVTGAELELSREDASRVRHRMRQSYAAKKSAQPILARTCGCVFKNPESGEPAGKLLDMAGFRGATLGGAGFSRLHAHFLVNWGGGRSEGALELIERARNEILRRFGVDLEREVQVV